MMNDKTILKIGNYTFGLFFLLGNICLFGFIITDKVDFALGGYFLLMFGSVLSLIIVLGLIIYGLINKRQIKSCLRAAAVICINIPIAILYFYIGTSLLNL
ncbi:hypothetical protein CHRY9390_00932 [Chryseobacterium aquaeductus]|uniref:Branched-chain amino acid:cation transporter, LIVCS family n=1 Tax=Chryseobacterium aquaeductus TaxID=2675056 RepID=A0A9N8MEY4_9FLAO|nr:hypothetical protein [Chryseobacterium aquaeductus]CAA7330270.1 hypothetical protein CHRY9390_00932 [Chryseobacterium potabilaquae]CAD7802460.1 hypothetical protein CHRY9390_00932 [Chryseobacterium aquaeductus]